MKKIHTASLIPPLNRGMGQQHRVQGKRSNTSLWVRVRLSHLEKLPEHKRDKLGKRHFQERASGRYQASPPPPLNELRGGRKNSTGSVLKLSHALWLFCTQGERWVTPATALSASLKHAKKDLSSRAVVYPGSRRHRGHPTQVTKAADSPVPSS